MKENVSVQDVVDEMDVMTDESRAFLNRGTGELVTLEEEYLGKAESEDEDDDCGHYSDWERELIEKAREVVGSTDFLPLPDRYDIDEYRIMESFCDSRASDRIREELLVAIRGRGAFRCFKDAIHRLAIVDEWHDYRQQAFEKIAIDWLEERQIPYMGKRRSADDLQP